MGTSTNGEGGEFQPTCDLKASPCCCPQGGLTAAQSPLLPDTLGQETTVWGLDITASEGTEGQAWPLAVDAGAAMSSVFGFGQIT